MLQAVRYPELWRDNGGFDADGVLWSWTIDLAAGTRHRAPARRPRGRVPAHRRPAGSLPARYAVSVGDNALVRYDLTAGSAVEHAFAGAGGPGEAVFVPSLPGAADESNGWYVAYVYDPARDGSDLVILDASDFARQPVARIQLPQRVPYGFHGNWITSSPVLAARQRVIAQRVKWLGPVIAPPCW